MRARTIPALTVPLVTALMIASTACSSDDDDAAEDPSGSALAAEVTESGTFDDGAEWQLIAPKDWNGTLLVFGHGFVGDGNDNITRLAPDALSQQTLIDEGYALAGTSYASTGWATDVGMVDQQLVLDEFIDRVGSPERTIAWGSSMGALIALGLLEERPERFDGGMALCGSVAGSNPTWDSFLDAVFTMKTLLAPDLDLPAVGLTEDPDGAFRSFGAAIKDPAETPQGKARLALAAAYAGADWADGTTDVAKQTDLLGVAYFGIRQRVEVERRFGGNPSTNAAIDYAQLLDASGRRAEVEAVYAAAGLDLGQDLAALAAAPRIEADPAARAAMAAAYDPTGAIQDPVITLHTTGDPLFSQERGYADLVEAAGATDLLRQVVVDRVGHCNFSPAEVIATLEALVHRVRTGEWAELTTTQLEATALGFGPDLNVGILDGRAARALPDFTDAEPVAFPRIALTADR